ncbi:amidohydrolase [Paenibacillus sp. J31TS4]|uniref:M20 family metallopeptidase n=1 Tax=Paenibacillus sp. J31TS4 TaxID=2807195 RepID=UPI001B256C94|nr:M20 family metallopeptidase [Paenibacillus sp. J31TS4]GIP37218.1 amidohydrolase [Paenibacillus sp. J31TS4]
MKPMISETIDQYADSLKALASWIGSHPELGHEEVMAAAKLTAMLEEHGFSVERGVLGIPTAFLAVYDSGRPGPTVAFLCEYDALPELGHACGHHLIGTMGAGAAIGLKSAIDGCGGTIRVYGTPAEETKGAKVPMAAEGLFDDVDVALMAHPYYTFEASGESLAMDALQFAYKGKPAHAAASPHEGINALDAVLLLFSSINALRQQVTSDVRIHGIITEGGKAANIIPEDAVAQFYVRAATRPATDAVVRRVLACAEGAALQTGCTLTVTNYEYSYDELNTNRALSNLFLANLEQMGVGPERIRQGQDHGSLDLGNVSRRCPAIHPYIQVIDEKHLLHTKEFRDLAMTERALDAMLFGAKALAHTAYDVMTKPSLLKEIREEFERTTASSTL